LKVKTFGTPAAAQREADQLIREKLAKGYKEK
jgi:predicted DNA-binding WGR domain protein